MEDYNTSKAGGLMDDGELELLYSPNLGEFPSSGSMDCLLEELLRDNPACTHTHTCNPPGPDLTHTHTCFHVHTQIVEDKTDDSAESEEKSSSKKSIDRGGNREAVRKYRQKKKAHTALLEDEVVRLKAVNQHLLNKLQSQAVLEKEVARLKCVLGDVRARIEGEIGSFPYQRTSHAMNPCNVQCDNHIYCPHPGLEGTAAPTLNDQCLIGCDYENLNCLVNLEATHKELLNCGAKNVSPRNNKRKAM